MTLRVELERWSQTPQDLLHHSLNAEHKRTRERYLALYLIVSKDSNASQIASELGRENETVMNWVKLFNEKGPLALVYEHTGGRSPFLQASTKP